MNIKRIHRILVLVLILISLFFILSWEGTLTAPEAYEPNLRPSYILAAELPRNTQQTGVHALPQQYVAHDPIRISNNTDFATLGFPGEGTPSSPYIIEGLKITSETRNLVRIKDTTAYFCIRNNRLNSYTGEYDGILLKNVTHGTIDTNIITYCKLGIYFEYSEENTISNNTISHNSGSGIHLKESGYNTVAHNTISNSTNDGIHLWGSDENTLTHNTVTNANDCGIALENSGPSTVTHNTVSNCERAGIALEFAGQCTLIGNRLFNNGLVISFGFLCVDEHHPGPDRCGFPETVVDNEVNGRPLIYWKGITGGTVPLGAGQVFLVYVSGVEVTGQNLSRASIGVYAYSSKNLKIRHNTVAHNSQAGIFLDNCHGYSRYAETWTWTTVAYNTVTQNTIGILLTGGSRVKVIRNTITQNTIGIHRRPWDVYHNQPKLDKIAHNTVANNTDCGIVLTESELSTVFNNTVSHGGIGIRLEYSGHNTISNNTVSHNRGSGIVLERNSLPTIPLLYHCNNTITNNTLSNNSGNGIAIEASGHSTVAYNRISNNNMYGILLNKSENSIVAHNTVAKNTGHGIGLSRFCSDNTVKWNDFLGNRPGGGSQVHDDGSNNVFTYNYWNDHDNTDQNGDGIADAPYAITGAAANQDPFPMTVPANIPHSLSSPTIIYPNGGETLQGTVTIHWATVIDELEHSVTYAIFYSLDNGSNWTPIASGLSTTTYEWDTTTVGEGSKYLIRVIATCSEGLTAEDVSDTPFTIQNPAATTTVGAFPNPGEPIGILLATLLLAMNAVRQGKRKSR